MLRTSSSTDSSTRTAQIAVEYDRVDGGGNKSVEKSSKSKNLKSLKSRKGHRLRGTFTEAPVLRQLGYEELELPLEL